MKHKMNVSYPYQTIWFLILLSFLVCSLAFADGDTRRATQAEKDLNKTVLQNFAKAIPPGPAMSSGYRGRKRE